MDHEMRTTLEVPIEEARPVVVAALAEQGFGVLTEIDVQRTLLEKRSLEVDPYLILGACNPDLAHEALSLDPDIGTLLPCNVVLRSGGGDQTQVVILDPSIMATFSDHQGIAQISMEARKRLSRVLHELSG
jgi:uncharacterized protein (DUF302 family)